MEVAAFLVVAVAFQVEETWAGNVRKVDRHKNTEATLPVAHLPRHVVDDVVMAVEEVGVALGIHLDLLVARLGDVR